MFDTTQFSVYVLQEAATEHCTDCGEVLDSFDRCGCDYQLTQNLTWALSQAK